MAFLVEPNAILEICKGPCEDQCHFEGAPYRD